MPATGGRRRDPLPRRSTASLPPVGFDAVVRREDEEADERDVVDDVLEMEETLRHLLHVVHDAEVADDGADLLAGEALSPREDPEAEQETEARDERHDLILRERRREHADREERGREQE